MLTAALIYFAGAYVSLLMFIIASVAFKPFTLEVDDVASYVIFSIGWPVMVPIFCCVELYLRYFIRGK